MRARCWRSSRRRGPPGEDRARQEWESLPSARSRTRVRPHHFPPSHPVVQVAGRGGGARGAKGWGAGMGPPARLGARTRAVPAALHVQPAGRRREAVAGPGRGRQVAGGGGGEVLPGRSSGVVHVQVVEEACPPLEPPHGRSCLSKGPCMLRWRGLSLGCRFGGQPVPGGVGCVEGAWVREGGGGASPPFSDPGGDGVGIGAAGVGWGGGWGGGGGSGGRVRHPPSYPFHLKRNHQAGL